MGKVTGIEWCDSTWNPWWGCVKVSEACRACYAEEWAERFPKTQGLWGPGSPRKIASENVWNDPIRWNRAAEKAGERRRVFCASMADVFEDRRDLDEHRTRIFALIRATPWLDWLLLTKRTDRIRALQCKEAHVPLFFKQWGEWVPRERDDGHPFDSLDTARHALVDRGGLPNAVCESAGDGYAPMSKVGKKTAGSVLDGVEHKAFPVPA